MDIVYEVDPDVWVGHLDTRIRPELDTGAMVVMRTVSGATVLLLATDLAATAVRVNRYDPLDLDGIPLPAAGFEATSCGLWIPALYASSRPVLLASIPEPELDDALPDLHRRFVALMQRLHDMDHDWLKRAPTGHPHELCPVNHCVRRMGTT